jgi:hypothetical protein
VIAIDAAVLDWLVAMHWLDELHAGDRRAVGRAIAAMLADAAKG